MNNGDHFILLIEDNPNDVMLLQRAITRSGLELPHQTVEDGDAAVRYLAGEGEFADRQSHPLPTLVLMDLKLPRRSGFEILEWLRAQPGLQRLPVIVFSSSEQPADIHRAYELGANSYLVKPVRFEELEDILRALHAYWFHFNRAPEAAR